MFASVCELAKWISISKASVVWSAVQPKINFNCCQKKEKTLRNNTGRYNLVILGAFRHVEQAAYAPQAALGLNILDRFAAGLGQKQCQHGARRDHHHIRARWVLIAPPPHTWSWCDLRPVRGRKKIVNKLWQASNWATLLNGLSHTHNKLLPEKKKRMKAWGNPVSKANQESRKDQSWQSWLSWQTAERKSK